MVIPFHGRMVRSKFYKCSTIIFSSYYCKCLDIMKKAISEIHISLFEYFIDDKIAGGFSLLDSVNSHHEFFPAV